MPQADLEEQFSLKWNDYQSNLSTGFQHLLEEEIMLDVSLSAGGKLIQAHKLILSICSPYFKGLFQVGVKLGYAVAKKNFLLFIVTCVKVRMSIRFGVFFFRQTHANTQ